MPVVKPPQKGNFRSLSVTLALAFLGLSMSVVVFAVALEIFLSFQSQHETIATQQKLIAQNAAEQVSGYIMSVSLLMNEGANLTGVATLDAHEQKTILSKILGRNRAIKDVLIFDLEGARVQGVSRIPGENSGFGDFAPEVTEDFLAAAAKGETYISPVYVDSATNEPFVVMAVAIQDSFRAPRGVLAAEVNLKFMWDVVGAVRVGNAYVVDESGNLIAYGDTSRVLARENLRSLNEVGEFLAGGVDEDAEGAKFQTGIEGGTVVSTFVPLGTPDWAVIVEVPVLEAYSSIVTILFGSIAIVLFSVILAVISGIYLADWITAGIKDLSEGAEKITKGDLDARIPVTSNNEIGLLAASFNAMAKRLKETYATLDARVQEKTAALAERVTEVQRSKSAILNLLEDIEEEKKKVEGVVEVRTKELSAEKARLLASINSLSFGFLLADAFDQINLKNPALERILDYKTEPKTIHDIGALLKSADSKIDIDIAASCKRCVELKEPVEFKEVPYGKKYLRIICSPIITQSGPIGYIFLVEDITEAKVAERSRDEFFAVASHELRTPLTAIRGNADMILEMYADKIPDKDMREMLTDINMSSVRLIDIVNDFLEVSRLEQGKFKMKFERFNAADVVEKIMRDFKEMITKKGIALVYEAPPAPLSAVWADKNRTEQILVNFVGNSAKFTKTGSITISLAEEGGKVRFRVTDTGTGISEHNQTLLFRKFQQAGEQMLARDVSQGTGLGLYICKLIAGNMGGEVGLEKSELDKGSTFFFTIPVAQNP